MLHDSNANVSEAIPQHIDGITEFLRSEYHRKFGCFINGARDEESKLVQFWRENISEEARKKRERVAELKRAQSMKLDVDKDESNDLSKAQLRREAAKIEAEYNSTTKFQRPSTAKKNSQT